MKCAIMQPTYLPWAGYFNLIINSDIFVFLDDVQFERRSWQSRNRILLDGVEKTLSISTVKASQNEIIKNIALDDSVGWRAKHGSILRYAYGKAPFGKEMLDLLLPLLEYRVDKLSELNILIIMAISEKLGIKTKFCNASDLLCCGKRSEHLIGICNKVGADVYLSPIGAKEYLLDDQFEKFSNLKICFQDYIPDTYLQYKNQDAFISHLSVVDVIANLGFKKTRCYVEGLNGV